MIGLRMPTKEVRGLSNFSLYVTVPPAGRKHFLTTVAELIVIALEKEGR